METLRIAELVCDYPFKVSLDSVSGFYGPTIGYYPFPDQFLDCTERRVARLEMTSAIVASAYCA